MAKIATLAGLRLSAGQEMLREVMAPHTQVPRILVQWQTGVGKTIGAIVVAQEFARIYRELASGRDDALRVTVVGFTRDIVVEDLMRYPEFGFVTAAEVAELGRLRKASHESGLDSREGRAAVAFAANLKRRISDVTLGGHYRFYGYKEFASRLFEVTRRGIARRFRVTDMIFGAKSAADAGGLPESFGARLAEAVEQGLVKINQALLDSLRNGLLIADEVHNVYNSAENNIYGIALQYALDALDDQAPRVVLLSATPITSKAGEVADLLNLLVPRSEFARLGLVPPLLRSDIVSESSDMFNDEEGLRSRRIEADDLRAEEQEQYFEKGDTPDLSDFQSVNQVEEHAHKGSSIDKYIDQSVDEYIDKSESAARSFDQYDGISQSVDQDDGTSQSVDQGDGTSQSVDQYVDQDDGTSQYVDQDDGISQSVDQGDGTSQNVDQGDGTSQSADQVAGQYDPSADVQEVADLDLMWGGGEHKELKPGALELITRLARGRVSFVLDRDSSVYPTRSFDGELIPLVPYVPLVACPMSEAHQRVVNAARDKSDASLLVDLYDSVFPGAADPAAAIRNPIGGKNATAELESLLAESKTPSNFVAVELTEKTSSSDRFPVVVGEFLRLPTLRDYSAKYATMVDLLHRHLADPHSGKALVYHPRVRGTGVAFIREVLLANGFVDENTPAHGSTRCTLCGQTREEHSARPSASPAQRAQTREEHSAQPSARPSVRPAQRAQTCQFEPARFAIAHSGIDRPAMTNSIARFNAASNRYGHEIRVLLASRIIREGVNLRAVRLQLIVSNPSTFSVMIQVLGRTSRRYSHAELPPEHRTVRTAILVSTARVGDEPELDRYKQRGSEFASIQEVERAMHRGCVDVAALVTPIAKDSLEGLSFSVDAGADASVGQESGTLAYYARGKYGRDLRTTIAACRALLAVEPLWTFDDLIAALKNHAVAGYTAHATEALLARALLILAGESGGVSIAGASTGAGKSAANKAGKFASQGPRQEILLTKLGKTESCLVVLKSPPLSPALPEVRVADYLERHRAGSNFAYMLALFNAALEEAAKRGSRLALVALSPVLADLPDTFHYELVERLIEAGHDDGVTANDRLAKKLYLAYGIMLGGKNGYRTPLYAMVYEKGAPDTRRHVSKKTEYHFVKRPLAEVLPPRARPQENPAVVGVIATDSTANRNATPKFKIRPPLLGSKADARFLVRGAVCETRPEPARAAIVKSLRAYSARRLDAETLEFLRSQTKSCDEIRYTLYALEIHETGSVKHLYTFAEAQPRI